MLDLLINESPSELQVRNSLTGFVHRVQRYLYRIDVTDFEYDLERLEQAHKLSLFLLHQYINPSCFKAAAALTIGLCATRPFEASLPQASFKELADYPNAVFSILESIYWMHGAELLIAPNDVRKLEHPIEFSDHFFRELSLTAGRLGTVIDPSIISPVPACSRVHLRTLALVFEALAYQRNNGCKYPPPLALQIDSYFNILA
jgi:hypothetical protein